MTDPDAQPSPRDWTPLEIKLFCWLSGDDVITRRDGTVVSWNDAAVKPRKRHVTVTSVMEAEMRRRRPHETLAAIAADLDVSPESVRYHTKGIKGPQYPPLDVQRAISLLQAGCTWKQAAQRLGVSIPTFWKHLRRAGVRNGQRKIAE